MNWQMIPGNVMC